MRKTLQELNIHNHFFYQRGKFNNITDVSGIKVGHSTIVEGESVRTGVTSIQIPDLFKYEYPASSFNFSANGEMSGIQYIVEEGRICSPIFLTNTISLGDVSSFATKYYKGDLPLPIVGECWDGWLNDIWGHHVKERHIIEAIESAISGEIEQGSVGAGTGMTSFGFKSGIGSASRKFKILDNEYTVGVLVNNNMSHEDGRHRYLRINGIDYAKEISEYDAEREKTSKSLNTRHNNSSILIIATDAPLDSRQLNRLSKHAVLGFGRLGYVSYSGSGDFVLSFSTSNKLPIRDLKVEFQTKNINEILLDDVFEATIEAVEESYLNSLLTATDMEGKDGHFAKAIEVENLIQFEKVKKNIR